MRRKSFPRLLQSNVIPDVVTDQTPAHDFLMYIPSGLSMEAAADLRKNDPKKYAQLSADTMTEHVRAMLEFQARGAEVFDYGNNIRQRAFDNGLANAFDFPGFVPHISVLFSAKEKAHSAGLRCRARKRISIRRIRQSRSCFRKIRICSDG